MSVFTKDTAEMSPSGKMDWPAGVGTVNQLIGPQVQGLRPVRVRHSKAIFNPPSVPRTKMCGHGVPFRVRVVGLMSYWKSSACARTVPADRSDANTKPRHAPERDL